MCVACASDAAAPRTGASTGHAACARRRLSKAFGSQTPCHPEPITWAHRAFWLEVRVALVLLYGLIAFFLAVCDTALAYGPIARAATRDRAHLARSGHQAGARPRRGRAWRIVGSRWEAGLPHHPRADRAVPVVVGQRLEPPRLPPVNYRTTRRQALEKLTPIESGKIGSPQPPAGDSQHVRVPVCRSRELADHPYEYWRPREHGQTPEPFSANASCRAPRLSPGPFS